RRIAIINQKGGVGKTTTAVNLGAALARLGRRVLVVDMDPQANASMNLGAELEPGEPSSYTVLTQGGRVADTLRGTSTPGLSILPAHLDLSGAELELASAIGRETILRDALDDWERDELARSGRTPADVVLIDNPPSLGLLSVNGLAASTEVLIAVQTEFFALQGLSKLVEIVQLLRRRMNPELEITGVLACLYDSRLRLAREVLGELRAHFPEQVFRRPIAQTVKLAETPSFSATIFEYAPESKGAEDYLAVAREFLAREGIHVDDDGRPIEAAAASDAGDEGDDEPAPPAGTPPEPEPAAEADPDGGPSNGAPPAAAAPAAAEPPAPAETPAPAEAEAPAGAPASGPARAPAAEQPAERPEPAPAPPEQTFTVTPEPRRRTEVRTRIDDRGEERLRPRSGQ
ncbi:MAG: AAA family ATPase, partial [Planctomycetota bacterium]